MRLLITGGAGYIGSHVVLYALDSGYDVTVFDDLSTGRKKNINKSTQFIQGSTNSRADLSKLFKKNNLGASFIELANHCHGNMPVIKKSV